MDKKQKLVKLINNQAVFFLCLLICVFIFFVFLTPKVSSLLFQSKRQVILNDFVNKTKIAGFIQARDYWQFREFYSPGYFTYTKEGLSKALVKRVIQKTGINFNENDSLPFLYFSSNLFSSLDILTKKAELNEVINLEKIPRDNIIFAGKNCYIYKTNSNTIKIVYLLSVKDVESVSGISDYIDIQSAKEMYWLNITSLKTN